MAQILYTGGPILTLDPARPMAEALLTEDAVIRAVGSLSDLEALALTALRRDLQGHTLIPGFVDGHSHLCNVGLGFSRCDLTGCTSLAMVFDRIRAFRQRRGLTHGELLSCRGYDPNVMAEGRHPTARELDSLGFDNPILCIHQSGHMSVLNSAAMALCGVRRESGYFEEAEAFPLHARLNAVTRDQLEAAILAAQDHYLSKGITTAQDICSMDDGRLPAYEALARAGKLKLDVILYVYVDYDHPDLEPWLTRLGNRRYHNHLKLGGLKIMLDGSPQARTAWLRQPYEGSDRCGSGQISDGTLETVLTYAVEKGLQPIAHCNGDAACEQFLRVWNRVLARQGHGRELRPIMIHAQTVGDDQLDRMAAVGMMPSFFVGHCWFWGDTHRKNLGLRAAHISPIRAALDRGLPVSLHQDSPVTPVDMLFSMFCAVSRLTKSGHCLGPDQRITPLEALQAATCGGAYSYFEEDQKAMLRPGFRADLTVLDQNPLEAADLRQIRVLETVQSGRIQFMEDPLRTAADSATI